MPRIRTIKPEFFQDEKMAPLSVVDRFTFLGLICMADDFGRLLDNIRVIDAFIFPETEDSVRESIATLSRMGRIQRGTTASGQKVIQITNWETHQRVDKPQKKMALPELVHILEPATVREPFANDSRIDRESVTNTPEIGRENGGESVGRSESHGVHPLAQPDASGKRPAHNSEGQAIGKQVVSDTREPFAHDSRTDREPLAPHTYDLRPTTNDLRPTPSPDGEGAPRAVAPSPPCPPDSPPDIRPDIGTAVPPRTAFADADLELLDDDLDLSPPSLAVSTASHVALAVRPAVPPVASRPAKKRSAPRSATAEPAEGTDAPAKAEKRAPNYPHFPHERRAELMAIWRDNVMPLREDQKGRFVKAFAGWFTEPEATRAEKLPRDAEVAEALRLMLEARKDCYGGHQLAVPNYAAERIGLVVEIMRETDGDPLQRLNRIERALALKPILSHDTPSSGRR